MGPITTGWIDEDGLARIVATGSFRSKEGIGVDSPYKAIVPTFGEEFRRVELRAGWSIVYPSHGIDFVFFRDLRPGEDPPATALGVFRPGAR